MVQQGNAGSSSYICVGVIVAPHGIKGEVKIHSYTEQAEDLTAYGPIYNQSGTKTFRVKIKHVKGDAVIASLEGYPDRNSIETLRGMKLYIPREALPEPEEEEFYHEDLLNMKVVLPDATSFGTVKAIYNFGAGDVMEIALASGKTELLPFTKAVFPVINFKEGFLEAHLPQELIAKEGHE